LEAFNAELSRERNQVFTAALMDIWLKGTADAKADQREYTVGDYHSQLDGLSYDEVVNFTDPTGETAKQRYEQAKRTKIASPTQPVVLATPPPKARAEAAHEALDHGVSNGWQGVNVTPHGGSAVEGVAPSAGPVPRARPP